MKNFIFIWLCLSVNIVNVIARVPGQINEKTFDLIVLHNNDMHSRFDETNQFSSKCQSDDLIMGKCYGGFARVSEIIQRYRKMAENGDGPRVLYLNAGDTYMGTPWFTLYRDKIVSEFMNLLKPDAAVCSQAVTQLSCSSQNVSRFFVSSSFSVFGYRPWEIMNLI